MRQTEQNAAKFHVYLNLAVLVVPSAAECFAFLFFTFSVAILANYTSFCKCVQCAIVIGFIS